MAVFALVGIFSALLLPARRELRDEMQRKLIERAGAMLHPLMLQSFAARATDAGTADTLRAVLKSAEQPGLLAMAVFDRDGALVQAVPASLPFVDLPPADYLELTRLEPISRYQPDFRPHNTFGPDDTPPETAPVLEVLLPLYRPGENRLAGVVQCWIDARALAQDLAAIDLRLRQQAAATLVIAAALIGLVVGLATWRLTLAQRAIAERNERLLRTNLELSLAAKASVLGQITSHLLHGLQSPVAGLRAVMATRSHEADNEDWQTASDYTTRLQHLIEQTVTMLGERDAHLTYDLTAAEFAALLRERHAATAAAHGVALELTAPDHSAPLASHRGHLLALAVGNLIENALEVSPRGSAVHLVIVADADGWRIRIADAGPGLPDAVREHLFLPGRSTKPGGTGLGLAISHLLTRQIGAELRLDSTGPRGTSFSITLPTATE